MSSPSRSSQANRLAIFASATFVLAMAGILTLERIGAPDKLVRALGPIVVLLGLTVFGFGASNADLPSFLAAGRDTRPPFGGLSIGAIAAGMTFCLYPDLSSASNPPWLGVVLGVAIGAVGIGPLVRRFGATWRSDVIATRFSAAPIRIVSAAVVWSTAALTAFAGYRSAVATTEALVTPDPSWAKAIVAIVLASSVTPGGLTGLIWSAAASAGALAMIVAIGFVFGWGFGSHPFDQITALSPISSAFSSPASFASLVVASLAIGCFFPFEPASVGSLNTTTAIRAGFVGVVWCLVLATVASGGLSAFSGIVDPGLSSSIPTSLAGAAMLASTLSLAAAGVHGSSRAFGIALAAPRRPFPTLASVRLARMRGAHLLVVIGCAFGDRNAFLDARTALVIAMALSLALTTPLLALAAIGRAGPVSGGVAVLAALGVAYLRFTTGTNWTDPVVLFEEALVVGAAAFAAGALASVLLPRRGLPPTPGGFDPFAAPQGSASSRLRASS
jgi:cation/acetate symporter